MGGEDRFSVGFRRHSWILLYRTGPDTVVGRPLWDRLLPHILCVYLRPRRHLSRGLYKMCMFYYSLGREQDKEMEEYSDLGFCTTDGYAAEPISGQHSEHYRLQSNVKYSSFYRKS